MRGQYIYISDLESPGSRRPSGFVVLTIIFFITLIFLASKVFELDEEKSENPSQSNSNLGETIPQDSVKDPTLKELEILKVDQGEETKDIESRNTADFQEVALTVHCDVLCQELKEENEKLKREVVELENSSNADNLDYSENVFCGKPPIPVTGKNAVPDQRVETQKRGDILWKYLVIVEGFGLVILSFFAVYLFFRQFR